MHRIISVILMLLLLSAERMFAQKSLQAADDSIPHADNDTTSLSSAIRNGRMNGLVRYYFMATNNKKGLTDYYANALGGGLRYETADYHGFQAAASLYTIMNAGSSDMTKADPVTGQYSRYEIGLFDLQDPARKKDITRLEEAYVKYNINRSKIVVGRQLINTPFINLQDGRMRPTAVEGLWLEWNEFRDLKLEGGWLYAISPRSTGGWFTTGQSIGLYPVGVHTDGTKSQYADPLSVNTDGVALLGITKTMHDVKVQFWDILTENVFNTAMGQLDMQFTGGRGSAFFVSAQIMRQDAIKKGGNNDPAKAYIPKGSKAITFGGGVGWKNSQWESSISYNRITAHGRYLMPREWGRDLFMTFMPRERNEGFGDVHAITAKVGYRFPRTALRSSLTAGHFELPEINDFRLNKYMMPSYTQVNFDTRYTFSGTFKGLEGQFLAMGKFSDASGLPPYAVFNKVDMMQYNLVLNYHF